MLRRLSIAFAEAFAGQRTDPVPPGPVVVPETEEEWRAVLWSAVARNDERTVSALIGRPRGDVNERTGKAKRTLLHLACSVGARDALVVLLAQGKADPNARDAAGSSAVILAARNGYLDCIQALIAQSAADVHLRDNQGQTAVHWAAINGRTAILQMLLQIPDAAANDVDSRGQSALHVACQNGHRETVAILLQAGADYSLRDRLGRTPLFFACRYGQTECVKLLVERLVQNPTEPPFLYRKRKAPPEQQQQQQQQQQQSAAAAAADADPADPADPAHADPEVDEQDAREHRILMSRQEQLFNQTSPRPTHEDEHFLLLPLRTSILGGYKDNVAILINAFPFGLPEIANVLERCPDDNEPKVLAVVRHLCRTQHAQALFQLVEEATIDIGRRLLCSSSNDEQLVPGLLRMVRACTVLLEELDKQPDPASPTSSLASFAAGPGSPHAAGDHSTSSASGGGAASGPGAHTPSGRDSVSRRMGEALMRAAGARREEHHEPTARPAIASASASASASAAGPSTSAPVGIADKVARRPLADLWTLMEHWFVLLEGVQDWDQEDELAVRLSAMLHAFYIFCSSREPRPLRAPWIHVVQPPDLFQEFLNRHRGLLRDFLRSEPTLIFSHFHFLLDHASLMRSFSDIVRSQPFARRVEWFYDHLSKHASAPDPPESDFEQPGSILTIDRRDLFQSSCKVLSEVARPADADASDEAAAARVQRSTSRTAGTIEQIDVGERNIPSAMTDLKRNLIVQFDDEDGMGAGVVREWFDVLSKELLNPDYALFVPSADGATFQPNPQSSVNADHLHYFRFAGRVIGLALYHRQLLDIYFTRSFYKHILGVAVTVEDVASIDPEYHKNLLWLLENRLDDDIVETLGLTFSVDREGFGVCETVDLVPGGRELAVTEEHKLQYVQLVAEHKTTSGIKKQLEAFLFGFHEAIPASLISIFDEYELELLISGLPTIDADDWERNTVYRGFSSDDDMIRWFWSIVHECSQKDRVLLVQFVTGSSRVPLGGFANLPAAEGIGTPQKFTIAKLEDENENRLPSASTCFNLLKLPVYPSSDQLKEKLFVALRMGSRGFDFT